MRFADALWWHLREGVVELFRVDLERGGFEVRASRHEKALRARIRCRIRPVRALRRQFHNQLHNQLDPMWGMF